MEGAVAAVLDTTVTDDEPLTFPRVAVIVALPTAIATEKPCVSVVFDIVATELSEVLHVALVVRFCCEPSEYDPVAVNCWLAPTPSVGLDGETAIDVRVGEEVMVVEPQIEPVHAVIVAVPAAEAMARPSFVASFVTVATAVLDEAQDAEARSSALLSLKVPVAVSCWLEPTNTGGFAGVTAIDTRPVGVSVEGW